MELVNYSSELCVIWMCCNLQGLLQGKLLHIMVILHNNVSQSSFIWMKLRCFGVGNISFLSNEERALQVQTQQ